MARSSRVCLSRSYFPNPLPQLQLTNRRLQVITQCSIRHLYTTIPQSVKQIDLAKTFERRRCNHHTLDQPLSTLECFSSVLDPKSSHTNRHRYVVASQDDEVRRRMRTIPGVPLVYVKRSVMVMEPMADSSEGVREGMERGKFRSGLRSKRDSTVGSKRKKEDDDDEGSVDSRGVRGEASDERVAKKKRIRGPKRPNPLSIKKAKPKNATDIPARARKTEVVQVTGPEPSTQPDAVVDIVVAPNHGAQEAPSKRKRKRKHKSGGLEKLLSESNLDLAAQNDNVEA